jgi:hypothetical protein
MVPGLQDRILAGSEEEIRIVADLVCSSLSRFQKFRSAHRHIDQDPERGFQCSIR